MEVEDKLQEVISQGQSQEQSQIRITSLLQTTNQVRIASRLQSLAVRKRSECIRKLLQEEGKTRLQ
jgi:hypothetical protein